MTKGAKLRTLRVNRRGSAPKTGVDRYVDGSIVRSQRKPLETQEQVMRTALNAPHRNGLSSPLAGYPAGRLYLQKQIDKSQFQALERYTVITVRYMRHRMNGTIRLPGMTLERVARGSAGYEPDPEDIAALERAHADMLTAIQDTRDYRVAQSTMFRTGVMEQDVQTVDEMGAMRVALNSLCKLWGIEREAA